MTYQIEVRERSGIFDAVAEGVKKDIVDLGIAAVRAVSFVQVYWLEGELDVALAKRIAGELLADPISQEYAVFCGGATPAVPRASFVVEVAYNPGVMDPVEESALKGIRDLGISAVRRVRTAKKYILGGDLSGQQLQTISEKLLYNKLIQHIIAPGKADQPAPESLGYRLRLRTVPLLRAPVRSLRQISRSGQLFLNDAEMRRIQDYFRARGRNPTDCELETIAQTWSEHCAHKTFRGKIAYSETLREARGKGRRPATRTSLIDNLLKSTIMKVTLELKKPWCVSVFKDNAGVIRFDEKHNVCFKVETHNHPSALEPYGGANTGIGGVIRDPLGTGLGAKPIFNTDVFCFAPPDYPFDNLPAGTLHPKRVMKGVVSGVRDYGNKMGIPTINGAVLFDEGFVGNPLVYCGTAGIMPKEKSFKHPRTGEAIVVVGGRTGRDGIHGATFSSGELTHESEVVSSGAVQIGNPIQEKKMVDTILKARDAGLYSAITDCGAGGLSSAVGEMGQDLGARVDLEKVPLKYAGLSYTEIWISESQERMVLSVPQDNVRPLVALFAAENVEATVIGTFTDTRRLQLYFEGTLVCDLDMEFLHNGLPQITKTATFRQRRFAEPKPGDPLSLTAELFGMLSEYDVCSKEWVIRQYDHEVQGGSVIKPLAGRADDGPSDASVVRPVLGSKRGLIVSNGINFRYGRIDPYWMAASCIDEALRQIICVGGSLERVALLDNFCWGNPDKPDRLGGLVRAALGCYAVAKEFGVPFVSGKDSLYNEFTVGKKSIAIPGTLLISAIAVMDDTSRAVSMFAKEAGDLVYIVGMSYPEMGGSLYWKRRGYIGNAVPRVSAAAARRSFAALSRACARGLVRSMHDCSEGGLGVAAAEMAFAGGLGLELFLKEVPFQRHKTPDTRLKRKPGNDEILFSESNSRIIVEVAKRDQKSFERLLRGVPYGLIGCVRAEKAVRIFGIDGKSCVEADSDSLKAAWQKPLRW